MNNTYILTLKRELKLVSSKARPKYKLLVDKWHQMRKLKTKPISKNSDQ